MKNVHRYALIVVDMQNYYLSRDSSYFAYFDQCVPGSLDYIHERCGRMVIPVINLLARRFYDKDWPVIFLRLCSREPDRSDLHPLFIRTWSQADNAGFPDLYPLCGTVQADVSPQLLQESKAHYVNKGTFSAFTRPGFDELLRGLGVTTLVFTGLATSQCVETTARDGSDRGYSIIQIEDGQADYDEMSHRISLVNSRGVCDSSPMQADEFLEFADLNG